MFYRTIFIYIYISTCDLSTNKCQSISVIWILPISCFIAPHIYWYAWPQHKHKPKWNSDMDPFLILCFIAPTSISMLGFMWPSLQILTPLPIKIVLQKDLSMVIHHWFSNGLLSSGNKPFPEPMLNTVLRRHMASLGHDELNVWRIVGVCRDGCHQSYLPIRRPWDDLNGEMKYTLFVST